MVLCPLPRGPRLEKDEKTGHKTNESKINNNNKQQQQTTNNNNNSNKQQRRKRRRHPFKINTSRNQFIRKIYFFLASLFLKIKKKLKNKKQMNVKIS